MKLSIVGSGMIATEVMNLLTTQFPAIQIAAIFVRSKSEEKGRQLAERFGISHVYTSYEELLAEPVDFVYVANVNNVHYEYARKALLAGHNVIMEKPFCSTLRQAEELYHIALSQGLYLLEAVSLLYMPNFEIVRQALAKIGPVHIVECNYSQYSSRYDRYLNHDVAPAFDPACDGGALRDLNVYNINMVVGLFGAPLSAEYFANRGYNGVDTSGTMILQYPTFVASCTAAKDCGAPSFSCIQGERGWIRVDGPNNAFPQITICVDGKVETVQANYHQHRLGHEFECFIQIYQQKDYEQVRKHMNTTLAVMEVLEQGRKVHEKPL